MRAALTWLTALVVCSVAACGGSNATSNGAEHASGNGGERSIRLQVSGEPEETKTYNAIAAAYEQANPGAQVQVVPVPKKSDHLARLSTSFASGNPPDVFLVNYREYAQFVARGALEAVGPLIENAVDLDDYYEQPVEAFTYSGQLQCMPQNISSLVVYYNKKIFSGAGAPEPQAGWTFDDFARTAQRLTADGVRGLGLDASLVRVSPFVWSGGGDVVDDLNRPTRLTLDEPAARAVVKDLVGLVRSGAVPTEQEIAAQDLQTQFVTGKLAMLLSSRREVPALREVKSLDWDVAPLPVRNQPATILHADAYCLSRQSAPTEEAVRFISFATGKQGQTIAALSGRTVPSMKSVAQSPAFLDPANPPAHSKVFLDSIPVMRRTPVIPQWPEIEDVAAEQLTRAFYDSDLSLDDALAELDRRTRPLFARGGS